MLATTPQSEATPAPGGGPRGPRWHCRVRVCVPHRRLHAALATAAAFAAAAALGLLTTGPASAAAAPPAGGTAGSLTPRGLFAMVHRAYLHVPAVALTVVPGKSTLGFPRRFVLDLRSGVLVAEDFTRSGHDATTLVARSPRATYSRVAGSACWRRLPSPNAQTLSDVGIPFPFTRTAVGVGDKALPPRKTAAGWIEATESRVEYWFLTLQPRRPGRLLDKSHLPIKRFITYTVDARSHLLTSIFIQAPGHRKKQRNWLHATFRVSSLTSAPQIPEPTPAC
jgi:hypothetical protein